MLGKEDGCRVSGATGIVVALEVALDTAADAVDAYWQRVQMNVCLGRSARDLKRRRGGISMW